MSEQKTSTIQTNIVLWISLRARRLSKIIVVDVEFRECAGTRLTMGSLPVLSSAWLCFVGDTRKNVFSLRIASRQEDGQCSIKTRLEFSLEKKK